MRRFWPILACLALGPVSGVPAQEAPPAPIRHDAPISSDTRPPTRPESDAPTPPGKPDEAPEPAEPRAPAQPVEEAGPPAWKDLRENDREYAACRLALSLLGSVYEEIQPVTDADDPDCGIARPLRVTEILPGLELEGGAEMRCDTARALGFWARDFLRPAAATLPDSPRLTGLRLGSTYSCRARAGTGKKRPKLSEHALGNAVDIAAFLFDGAEPLPVQPREDSGDRFEAFQRSARATACLYFTTVLGPGSNEAHDDHLHLDVKSRKNGWRLCQ
ncbi:extensin-like domain-containing protein [Paracoccus methylarcula]|uniref:Extensin n=1 Tax=Paracoccus methylarcula TaxID=72022 RepID=A0A422QZ01_9RHOB|nr:extensin family protein [Paracoccus methylarcula]RNF35182.1 extensin [Paracoccus methylarcula]